MKADYFSDLLPASVTHVTQRKNDCVTPETDSATQKNSDLDDASRMSRMSRTKTDEAEQNEAIAEAINERAAILEYDAGLSRPEAEAEARRMTHAYRYKLHNNEGGGVYITSGDLETARAALLKRYGARLALVAKA